MSALQTLWRVVILLWVIWMVAHSQTLTVAPQPTKVRGAMVYAVVACPPPGTAGYSLPVGQVYRQMVQHSISPLMYAAALEVLHDRQDKSFHWKLFKYGGYILQGVTMLVTTTVVHANVQMQQGAALGAAFLNVLLPMVQRDIPPQLQWEHQLARDTDLLRSGPGECSSAFVLGSVGGAPFTVDHP